MKYLLDTNILIYYFNGSLSLKAKKHVSKILKNDFNISVISKMEFLGFNRFNAEQKNKAAQFLFYSNIIPLSDLVIDKVIQIKQADKIKLPDAIIAATALCNHLQLVTHNCKDFVNINIKVYDPC